MLWQDNWDWISCRESAPRIVCLTRMIIRASVSGIALLSYRRPLTFDIVGNVRLCNHSPVIAGNIYQQELSEILFSDYPASWVETKAEACLGCRKWDACHGGCRAAAEQLGGSLRDVDPVVKEQMLKPFI